jgi:hypothetical protein
VTAYWPALATIVFAAVVLLSQERVLGIGKRLLDREGSRPPSSAENRYVTSGRWIGRELPHAVVMCRNPWELLFYTGPANRAVGLPDPDDDDPRGAEKIFAIARYYGVTHMLGDVVRPCMAPYFSGREPGLKKVEGAPRDLYEIDWDAAPKKTVDQLFGK